MRKTPKQERSQKMVDTLLDATAKVLVKQGYDHTNTNKIAEVAGVSVGSLYQYFGDKESLIEALLMRGVDDLIKTLNATMHGQDLSKIDLEVFVQRSIRIALNVLSQNPLHAELLKQWFQLPVFTSLKKLENYLMDLSRSYFLNNTDRYPITNLHEKLYVIINSTIFTVARYLSEPQPMLNESVLLTTIEKMVIAVLLPDKKM